jgi:hypothetical protein
VDWEKNSKYSSFDPHGRFGQLITDCTSSLLRQGFFIVPKAYTMCPETPKLLQFVAQPEATDGGDGFQ